MIYTNPGWAFDTKSLELRHISSSLFDAYQAFLVHTCVPFASLDKAVDVVNAVIKHIQTNWTCESGAMSQTLTTAEVRHYFSPVGIFLPWRNHWFSSRTPKQSEVMGPVSNWIGAFYNMDSAQVQVLYDALWLMEMEHRSSGLNLYRHNKAFIERLQAIADALGPGPIQTFDQGAPMVDARQNMQPQPVSKQAVLPTFSLPCSAQLGDYAYWICRQSMAIVLVEVAEINVKIDRKGSEAVYTLKLIGSWFTDKVISKGEDLFTDLSEAMDVYATAVMARKSKS